MANVSKGKGRPAKKLAKKAPNKSVADKVSTLSVQTARGKSVKNAKAQNTRGGGNTHPAANEVAPKPFQADSPQAEQVVNGMNMADSYVSCSPQEFVNQTMALLSTFSPGNQIDLVSTLAGLVKNQLEYEAKKARQKSQELLDQASRLGSTLRNILNQ